MIRTGAGIVKGEEVMAAIEIIDEINRKPLNRKYSGLRAG
jgi:hypothetical protein